MTDPASNIEMTGYALPLADATALAEREGWRQRVLIYLTRAPGELLVFEHPSAGIQVPAGGVKVGEAPDQTATREAFEETGLVLQNPVHLASYHWAQGKASQIWHYFWLQAPAQAPDAWDHRVTGGGRDEGMVFGCRFVPAASPALIAGFRYEEALPQLTEHLSRALPSAPPMNSHKEICP